MPRNAPSTRTGWWQKAEKKIVFGYFSDGF